jgi:hypothetical protein
MEMLRPTVAEKLPCQMLALQGSWEIQGFVAAIDAARLTFVLPAAGGVATPREGDVVKLKLKLPVGEVRASRCLVARALVQRVNIAVNGATELVLNVRGTAFQDCEEETFDGIGSASRWEM